MLEKSDSQKKTISEREEEILALWNKNKIFEKTLKKKSPKGEFVFYDGPPFATGLPHYGHILAGIIKDTIPRYKTMRGFHVRRRWGWDCHGLPVENLIEKELGLKTKKDIEEYGIEKFNKAAEENVLRYADEWRKVVPRTGRWVDMERDYRTMDATYTESVWWVFKTLFDKKLIYEGFKSMHLCPRCETTLSNFEVSQGYVDITDISVTVKLRLEDETNTYLLVWTTTPWTLPGNMAAAINKNIAYGKFRLPHSENPDDVYILANKLADKVLGEGYESLGDVSARELLGKKYNPPFPYYCEMALENKENAWKVYDASYVGEEDGTGIVHLAPAFGEEDLTLAEENKIPIVHHVGMDGRFKEEVRDFAGLLVKPKDDHQSSDIEIIKYLAGKNLLFKKEKITHSYPLCWRCETPLLNYAANSWFIAVTKIKDNLIAANKSVNWVPADIKDGRFGNWLRGARDWAVSRTRFWGAPIPVWRNEKTGKITVLGSIEDLKKRIKKSGNTYFMMRHGESESNLKGIVIGSLENGYHLTEKGIGQVKKAAEKYKEKKIDVILSSPLLRAKETAEIFADSIGFNKEDIVFDSELRETGFGSFEGKSVIEYHKAFPRAERFDNAAPGGETLADLKKRLTAFLYEVEEKYSGKTILFVSHSDPLWMLLSGALSASRKDTFSLRSHKESFMDNAEIRELAFTPLPHDEEFILNLHRPYIDEVSLIDEDGTPLVRVPDVFDCWFESGAMPYGENHHPFENSDTFNPQKEKGFPADFIAEGLDQTRGWFYSLLVLSVALFGKSAYKNVIVSGLVLAEDGKKMSKRLKNYPDPAEVIKSYSADALRFYLLSSPLLRAEDINFSEKSIKEVQNKVISRAQNVLAFYELYPHDLTPKTYNLTPSSHVLDRWICARLSELQGKVVLGIERYELDKAARPIAKFVDDLSTWYLRRSRERLKSVNEEESLSARTTLQFVLLEFSKIIAPFMPFVADDIYLRVGGEKESVHLEDWPELSHVPIWPNVLAFLHRLFGSHKEIKILSMMERVRYIVSMALEARAKNGIKVRQPLKELRIKNPSLAKDTEDAQGLLQLIKDEVNVKEIIFDTQIEEEVLLDTLITPELKKEGHVRELIRVVQDLRKHKDLLPRDKAKLFVATDERGSAFIEEQKDIFKEATMLGSIEFSKDVEGEEINIGDMSFTFSLTRKD